MPVDERFRYQHRRAGRLIIATVNNPHGPKRRRHTHLARVDLCATLAGLLSRYRGVLETKRLVNTIHHPIERLIKNPE